MHFLMFQMKRAHLSSLSAAREFCEEVELTPARFDLLRAASRLVQGTHQYDLWKLLGLSRTTISKMVRLLIDRGLLSRVRSPFDRRTFLVSPTEEGTKRMRLAWARIHREQPFQIRYEHAFGEWSPSTAHAIVNLNWALRRSAQHLGDRSCEFYRSRDTDGTIVSACRAPGWLEPPPSALTTSRDWSPRSGRGRPAPPPRAEDRSRRRDLR